MGTISECEHRRTQSAGRRRPPGAGRGPRGGPAAAEAARGEHHARRERIRDAHAACLAQLAEARDTARLDIQRRYRHEAVRLAGAVRHLAAQSATGAAGLPWRMWTPTEPPPGGHGPGL